MLAELRKFIEKNSVNITLSRSVLMLLTGTQYIWNFCFVSQPWSCHLNSLVHICKLGRKNAGLNHVARRFWNERFKKKGKVEMQMEKQDQGSNIYVVIIVFKLIICGEDIEEKNTNVLSFGRIILNFTSLLLLKNECPMKALFQARFKPLVRKAVSFIGQIYVLNNPMINHCKCQAQENLKGKRELGVNFLCKLTDDQIQTLSITIRRQCHEVISYY